MQRRNGYYICFLSFISFFSLILIGDRVLVIIQVRRRRYFIVLEFTVVSRCILGNGRRGNLEHRRRGGESVLRKACTRASTSRQTFVIIVVTVFRFALPILFLQCYCNLFDM